MSKWDTILFINKHVESTAFIILQLPFCVSYVWSDNNKKNRPLDE